MGLIRECVRNIAVLDKRRKSFGRGEGRANYVKCSMKLALYPHECETFTKYCDREDMLCIFRLVDRQPESGQSA